MKKNIIQFTYALTLALPSISFAAFDSIKNLLREFKSILDLLIPIVFALALIFFFWGIAQFIRSAGDTKTLESGKNKMIWGIVGLFVMISIYGIIKYIGNSLGIETPISSSTPCPPGTSAGITGGVSTCL
jgi:K+-transporting ATPase A subunit